MANIKTSNEASGAPIEKTDLFRIARSGDNYKLTTQEIFTETVSRSTLQNKMTSSQLIPGRIYKVPNPTTGTLTDLMYVQAVSNTQIDSNVAIEVDNVIYPAYYDFANDVFGYIDTTYANLRTTMLGGKLVPGMTYRISDYVSKNFLNGDTCAYYARVYGAGDPSYTPWGAGSGDPNYNAFDVYTSPVEPLYVKAIGVDKLDRDARSELYPDDIIYYNPYLNILGIGYFDTSLTIQWDAVNNYAYVDLPSGNPLIYGQSFGLNIIIYDGVNYTYAGFYTELLLPGLNKSKSTPTGSYPTYLGTNGSSKTVDIEVVNNGNKIIISNLTNAELPQIVYFYVSYLNSYGDMPGIIYKRIDTVSNIKWDLDFRNIRYRRFKVDMSNINPIFSTSEYIGISDNYLGAGTTGDYVDFPVILKGGQNVSVEGYNIDNTIFVSEYLENVIIQGLDCRDNTFIGYFADFELGIFSNENVIISSNCMGNKLGMYTTGNIIKSPDFYANNFTSGGVWNNYINVGESIAHNIVSAFFGENVISGTNFTSNLISTDYEYAFIDNTITGDFTTNQIYNKFESNLITDFLNNSVKASLSSYNFTAATHVQSLYDCEIVLDSTSNNKLIYCDGTQYLFVSPTS